MTENVRNERESRETGRTLTPAGTEKIAGPPAPTTNNFSNPCVVWMDPAGIWQVSNGMESRPLALYVPKEAK